MTEDVAVKIQNLSKAYRLYDRPIDRLKESLHPFGRKFHKDFYALTEIDLEIKKGETVGIIGKNGSGKSTLLKIISGVLNPTGGNATVNGKVSALLELGAGFNPELTGIENIYFNGTLMGYSREEMDANLDNILAFADIGEYVYQPVKTYSSGMFVRLAFAVAVTVDPDVLIVDEALAVGDMQFQKKCMDKMNEFRAKGKTILFVSHNLYSIRVFCSYAILLRNGKIVASGKPDQVADVYMEDMDKDSAVKKVPDIVGLDKKAVQTHIGDIASITSAKLLDPNNLETRNFATGEKFVVEIQYRAKEKILKPSFGMAIFYKDGDMPLRISSSNTKWQNASPEFIMGDGIVKFSWHSLPLLPGNYSIWLTIKDEYDLITYHRIEDAINFKVVGEDGNRGILRELGIFYYPGEWCV